MNKNLICAEIAKLLDLPLSAITDELPISEESGWDSIVTVSFVAFLITEFDCRMEIEELMATLTVGDLWGRIETKVGVMQ
jgi:acyl carrier protein